MFEGWTSPFAVTEQQTQDRNTAWDAIKNDPGTAALIAGLSMLSNNNGRNTFGQLVGRAGFDTLAGVGSMEAQRRAQERYQQQQNLAMAEAARKRQKDAWDMGMQAAQFGLDRDNYLLERDKQAAELAGWRMLQGVGGAPSVGSGGVSGAPNSSNPLNMRVPGGTDFQSFDSPGDAFTSYLGQLRLYQGRGLVTPAQMIAGDDVNGQYVPGWAPAADGNDTEAYIRNVGQWTGLDMHAPINLDDPVAVSRLMSGMARMEQKDGARFTPEVIQAALSGQSVNTGGVPATGGLSPAVVPDSVPRLPQAGTVPTFGGVDRSTLERVALMPGNAGAAARQILGMRKDAFGAQQPKIDDVSDLGKRWLSESKNYLSMMDSANQLLASAKENSAAGDIAMIFTFMKALDPTSVVREGEQASAQNAAGVPERVRNVYNNLLNGKKLSPRQRKEFISLANSLVKSGMPEQERRNKYFTDLSKAYNISPSLVVREFYPGLTDAIDSYLAISAKDENTVSDVPGVSGNPSGSVFAGGGGGGGGVGAGTTDLSGKTDEEILKAAGLI